MYAPYKNKNRMLRYVSIPRQLERVRGNADGGATRELSTGDTREANNYREHMREYNSAMAFKSMSVENKPPPENGPYCFRIQGQVYHYVKTRKISQDMNNFIFAAGAAIKQLENQLDKECLAKVMQGLDWMLQANLLAEPYKRMHEMRYMNK
jgi:hypothetical protein